MDPIYILILMLSVSSLLTILLFIVRKKANHQEKTETKPDTTPLKKTEKNSAKTVDIQNLDISPIKNPDTVKSEQKLDLSSLEEISLDEFSTENNTSTSPSFSKNETKLSDLVELIKRYRFFQGENLNTFTELLLAKDFAGIEKLICEKFIAQGKENAQILAQETSKKLLGAL